MKGVKQKFEYHGEFMDFFKRVQMLDAIGGGFVFKDGHGFFVEPDLTETFGLDVQNIGEIRYKNE